jgi:hypothetical protein
MLNELKKLCKDISGEFHRKIKLIQRRAYRFEILKITD